MCVYSPPHTHTAAFGSMSLMQFWTKLYSQLGRPLPKVLFASSSFFAYFRLYEVSSLQYHNVVEKINLLKNICIYCFY